MGAPLWNCGDCLYNQFGTIVEVNTPCFSGMAIVLTDGSYIYNSNISDFGFAVGDVIKFSSSVPEQNPMVCPDNGEYMVYYAINCAAPAECYESALAIQYQNILCPDVYEPVCGCNGVTYPNTCAATANGITSWSVGECSPIPSDCNGCNTENPLTDLPWLAALTQQQCIGSITMITHSSGQSYFYTGGGFPCTDVPSYLYDCQGNQLCGFGGLIIWENNDSICNTLWENIICEEIIWTAPPPCFCEEFGYAPVCANGITYINACEAECSGVFDYVVGECNIIPNDTTYIYGSICLNDSTAVMFSDMLGSFGDEEGVALTLAPQNGTVSFTGQPWEQSFTYIPNSGFLGTDTFVFAATGIQITADGSFQEYTIYIRKYTVEVLADCNIGCVCPAIYAPVCADGITYGNACEAQCAGVYDYTNGECGSDTTVIACQVCNVQNPLAELDWLSGFVGQECLNSITAITHANGQSYFYISNGFPCLDAPSYVYDCQGNAVCGFGGLIIWEENDTAFAIISGKISSVRK
ncbi:MAG: hypothetical protein IPL35_12015 [Sphingobacteriales bacterium]|nr:hypothetical protein [Sphingobacteriales bacterium]